MKLKDLISYVYNMDKKLRGIKGHEQELLASAGFRDIYDAKRQWGGPKKGSAKEIYKFLLQSYNDEVDARRAEAKEIEKIKASVKQVDTIPQLYRIVKDAFQSKTQFRYKFITKRGTVLRDFNFTPLDTLGSTWSSMLFNGIQETRK